MVVSDSFIAKTFPCLVLYKVEYESEEWLSNIDPKVVSFERMIYICCVYVNILCIRWNVIRLRKTWQIPCIASQSYITQKCSPLIPYTICITRFFIILYLRIYQTILICNTCVSRIFQILYGHRKVTLLGGKISIWYGKLNYAFV